jgi:hypothetical protein
VSCNKRKEEMLWVHPVIDHDRLAPQSCLQVANSLGAGDSVLGLATCVAPTLSGESLVVVLTKVHAELLPCVEVAGGGDASAAGTLVLPVADVLDESGSTNDGRLVGLGVLPDVVDGAVASDGAHFLALSGTSAVAGVLLDVVLNQGALGPSVDGDKDGTGSGGGGTLEVDLAGGSLLPALSDDEVTGVGEVDRVAVVGGAELDVAAGLVVLVVVLATGEVVGAKLEVGSISHGGDGLSSRSCERADSGGESKDHGSEGNPFDDLVIGTKSVFCCVVERVNCW